MGCCHSGIRPPPCEEINQISGIPARAPGCWAQTGYFPGTGSLIRPWKCTLPLRTSQTHWWCLFCATWLCLTFYTTRQLTKCWLNSVDVLRDSLGSVPEAKNCGTNNSLHPVNSGGKKPKLQSHLFYFCSVATLRKEGEKCRFDRKKKTTRQQCSTFSGMVKRQSINFHLLNATWVQRRLRALCALERENQKDASLLFFLPQFRQSQRFPL